MKKDLNSTFTMKFHELLKKVFTPKNELNFFGILSKYVKKEAKKAQKTGLLNFYTFLLLMKFCFNVSFFQVNLTKFVQISKKLS